MNVEFEKKIDFEVERYRNTLLFYAKQYEWDVFKVNAGRLFDYLEAIEMSELWRKFFKVSTVIVLVLFIVGGVILKLDMSSSPEITKLKKLLMLFGLAGCCYEMFFFFTFNTYKEFKVKFYKKRRERFIIDIEGDFRDMLVQTNLPRVSNSLNPKTVFVEEDNNLNKGQPA